jgi:hypothetical protein
MPFAVAQHDTTTNHGALAMNPIMRRFLIGTAILIGVPIGLLSLLVFAYFNEFPLPVSSDQFRNDWKFKSLVTQGDQIVGGGYSFAEARDIWIRIRLSHEPKLDSPLVTPCSPAATTKIRTWFLEQAAEPPKILWILPISAGSQADKMALNDLANLRCQSTEDVTPMTHRFGNFPHGCSFSWILYHPPSGFYYERSPCDT